MESAGAVARELSGGGRWIVLGAVVPVLLGLGATVALWQGVDHDVWQAAAPAEPPSLHDGSVLVLDRFTSTPLQVTVGQRLEVQVDDQRGLNASASDAAVLATIPPPSCQHVTLCLGGVYRVGFEASHPGVALIVLDYGTGCVPTPCRSGIVIKTITVLPRPQTLPFM